MFCGNCGNQVEDGANVCTKCGFMLNPSGSDKKKKDKKAKADATVIENTMAESVADAGQKVEEVQQKVEEVKEEVKQVTADVKENVQQVVENVPVPVDNVSKKDGNGKKKKSIVPIIVAGFIGTVVLVLAIIFLCSSSLRNSLKKAFMSEDSYYKSVQKDTFMAIADTVLYQYGNYIKNIDVKNLEVKLDSNLAVEKEADNLLEKIDNATREDYSWLKKGALSLVIGTKDSKLYATGNLDVNKEDIVDIDAKVDLGSEMAYIGLTTLSDTYAAIDLSKMAGSDENENSPSMLDMFDQVDAIVKALPAEKELNKIVEKYVDIFLNSISKVKMTDDKVVKVSGVSVDCTKVVINFDAEDLVDIDIKMLEALGEDNEVAAIINRLSATEIIRMDYDAFLDGIDERIEKLKEYDRKNIEARIEAYIDSAGDVVAFDLTVAYNGGSTAGGYDRNYGYKVAENDGNYGFEVYKTYTNRTRTRTESALRASGTKSGSKLTGTVEFIENDIITEHLEYNELNLSDLLKGELDGQFIFNVYERSGDKTFKNIELNIECDGLSLNGGEVVVNVLDNKVAIAKLTTNIKRGSGSSTKIPSKTEEVKSVNDLTDWMDTFKWDKTLKNMESADLPKRAIRVIEALSEGNFASLMNLLGFGRGEIDY